MSGSIEIINATNESENDSELSTIQNLIGGISTDVDCSPVLQNLTVAPYPKNKKYATLSEKADLVLPVSHILKKLKKGNYADKVQKGAGVYCTAVIEYLCAEVLELAGNTASEYHKKRITPRHINLGIRNDDEIDKLLKNVMIYQGGVSKIHAVLLPIDIDRRSSG